VTLYVRTEPNARGWACIASGVYVHPQAGYIVRRTPTRWEWRDELDGASRKTFIANAKAQRWIALETGWGRTEKDHDPGLGWSGTAHRDRYMHPDHGEIVLCSGGYWVWKSHNGTVGGKYLSLQEAKRDAASRGRAWR
jgi:hypothetical protein